MKQKMVIRVQMRCKKCKKAAMKIAASEDGVISVTLQGSQKDEILLIGNEVDSVGLCATLRKKVGDAIIISIEEVKDPKPEEKKKDNGKKADEEKKPEEKKPDPPKEEEKPKEKKPDPPKEEKTPCDKNCTCKSPCSGMYYNPCPPPQPYYCPPPNPQCYLYSMHPVDNNQGCYIM